jgi:hypothetical protein
MARKLAVHLYWMWRPGLGLWLARKARFARGRAREIAMGFCANDRVAIRS